MYAICGDGYRAISGPNDLLPGETLAAEIPADAMRALRIVEARVGRDLMLRASDWTQMPDAPMSEATRASWGGYRQALRDLPQQPGFPDCAWPTAPDA
jgi:hypothetical protein